MKTERASGGRTSKAQVKPLAKKQDKKQSAKQVGGQPKKQQHKQQSLLDVNKFKIADTHEFSGAEVKELSSEDFTVPMSMFTLYGDGSFDTERVPRGMAMLRKIHNDFLYAAQQNKQGWHSFFPEKSATHNKGRNCHESIRGINTKAGMFADPVPKDIIETIKGLQSDFYWVESYHEKKGVCLVFFKKKDLYSNYKTQKLTKSIKSKLIVLCQVLQDLSEYGKLYVVETAKRLVYGHTKEEVECLIT